MGGAGGGGGRGGLGGNGGGAKGWAGGDGVLHSHFPQRRLSCSPVHSVPITACPGTNDSLAIPAQRPLPSHSSRCSGFQQPSRSAWVCRPLNAADVFARFGFSPRVGERKRCHQLTRCSLPHRPTRFQVGFCLVSLCLRERAERRFRGFSLVGGDLPPAGTGCPCAPSPPAPK